MTRLSQQALKADSARRVPGSPLPPSSTSNDPRLAQSRTGMVTSPHTLASEAGAKVLREGGNAIEAAIAMGAVIAVTYPHFCGIGGDAIWMIADAQGRNTVLLGLGQAAEKLPNYKEPIAARGPQSTVVSAGAVDSWRQAYDYAREHWASDKGETRSFASLLEPAIVYAERGFPVTGSQLFWTSFREKELANWPGFSKLFLPDGKAPKPGDLFVQKDLAHSLKQIARHGAREFYEGELAARIGKGLEAVGSPLTAADLAKTFSRQEQAVSVDYRDVTLLAPPPPTQGITTLEIMGILNRLGFAGVEEGSAEYYHRCVEAVKQAFLDRGGIADPDFAAADIAQRLAPSRLESKAAAIKARAMPWPHLFRTGDTVYFAATDAQGRSVSILQSTYFDWGSGVVAGDTGVLWQNRGAAFSIDPKSPNAIAPGKRPFYTLNPGLAMKNGKPHVLYGTQGADGQPQTLTVLLTRLLDYGLDPLTALMQPRFLLGKTFSDSRDTLKLEESVGMATAQELSARGHETSMISANSPLGGQAGAIVIHDDGLMEGAHDPRSDGLAIGL
ncbi:gamma-glutamyltransferase [Afipia sp. 1NLS2]|nr:gamma-glutamyltransferase [Afipia sp. 1NLS2]